MSIIMKDQADKAWIKTVGEHEQHWQEPEAFKPGFNLDTAAAMAIITLLIIVITFTQGKHHEQYYHQLGTNPAKYSKKQGRNRENDNNP